MKKLKRILLVVFALICFVLALVGVNSCAGSSNKSTGLMQSATYSTEADFDLGNKKVGFEGATVYEKFMLENYPTAELYYYSNNADSIAALNSGKIDALLIDLPMIYYMATSLSGLAYVPEPVLTTDICFMFPKDGDGSVLQMQVNGYLAELESNGTLSSLRSQWLNGVVINEEVEDYTQLPATNGVLTFATCTTNAPFSYISDNKIVGFEVDIAIRFCKKYGYGLEIMDFSFEGLLSAVSSGKADFGAAGTSYSEERAKSINFSTRTLPCEGVVVYRQTEEDAKQSETAIESLGELTGKRIGYQIGTVGEEAAITFAGDTGITMGFNSIEDAAKAVSMGKVDAAFLDTSQVAYCIKDHEELVTIGETGKQYEVAAAVNPDSEFGEKIKNMINVWIRESRQNGLLDSLVQKWTSGNVNAEMSVDIDSLPATNGRITAAVSTADGAPRCILRDGKYVGLDIEILALVAQANGYALDLVDYSFTDCLLAVASGKCDICGNGFFKTEEREQIFDFTDIYYLDGESCIVRSAASMSGSFFGALAESFERTFVSEDRWQLFLVGVGITMLITLCSLVIGSLLGFIFFRLCFKRGRVINAITDFCVWLVTGMPTIVLLMILFYIVFGSTTLDGVSVSIFGFSLIFAATVIGMLRVGCSALDEGEIDAATALGFSNKQIFYRIVMPQAINHILPVYKSETVTLLKGTAIVGYIAVQDLTKVGDIIRSRTFEAFFPLIAIAVFYYILAAILKIIVNVLAKRLNPQNRSAEQIYKSIGKMAKANKSISLSTGLSTATQQTNSASERKALIELCHVGKDYGSVAPLKDIDAKIYKGECVGIIGPSGCGKSTLLKCINLLDPPTSGEIYFDGELINADKSLSYVGKRIGMVFQRFNLFSHWTVLENIMIPQMLLLGKSKQEAYECTMNLLKRVDLTGKEFSYPKELSGGQQQRVAIARTLAMDPEVILFDEPTSALDPQNVDEVKRVITDLASSGATMMIVSHDMNFIKKVVNRVFYLDEGIIYEDSTPKEIFYQPRREKTKNFIFRVETSCFEITDRNFDFTSMVSWIYKFGGDFHLSSDVIYGVQLAVEELVMSLILPALSDEPHIRLIADFDKELHTVTIKVLYNGNQLNPLDLDNTLALDIIKAKVGSMAYSVENQEDFTNGFTMTAFSR